MMQSETMKRLNRQEQIDLETMAVLIEQNKAKPINPGEPKDHMVIIGNQYYIKSLSAGYYQRLSYSND